MVVLVAEVGQLLVVGRVVGDRGGFALDGGDSGFVGLVIGVRVNWLVSGVRVKLLLVIISLRVVIVDGLTPIHLLF